MPSAVNFNRDVRGRREQILDAAFALLGEVGYRGLSFQELASQCDLTKQGVLHYFPTKPRLLFALLDERDASIESFLLDRLSASGFDGEAGSDGARAILQDSLVAVVERMIATPGLIKLHVVLRAEAMGSDHPAKDYFLKRDRATRGWLVQRIAVFEAQSMSLARQILAAMLGLQQQWLQEGFAFDLLSEWRSALAKLLETSDLHSAPLDGQD